ncbi:MAG: ribokinase [Alphaproteobacteria bacterium]|jgi:ribokinase|nr:ribokinase [Alphaproteobacteria bacterium]MDP6567147.1 ribokinase [Alphaproteobacteria bacterium]MDP6816055.1 ribokinase [Alphaproteobacteria bacterium]
MITVFGSIGMDVVQSVARLPRPGETVLTPDYALLPGGKGANQALAAARAGAPVRMIATVGDDDFGRLAVANLADAGVDLDWMAVGTRPTACATVCVAEDGENQIVVASGANLETHAGQLAAIELSADDLVLLQLEITLDELPAAVRQIKAAGARSVLNAAPFKPLPSEVLEQLDVLIVNEIEARMLADDLGLAATDPIAAGAALAGRLPGLIVLTLGADGTVAFAGDGTIRATVLPIRAVDTVGAGDAFLGAFAAALHDGAGLADCLRRGNTAGGLTCLTPGAQDGIPEAGRIAARQGEIEVSELV